MNKILLNAVMVFTIFIFTSCKKDKFGDYNFEYVENVVYQAEEDGFVTVNVKSNGSEFKASLLTDTSSEPTTEIASVIWDGGSMTIPIKKDYYWKVTHNNVNVDELEIDITWIPLK